MSYSASYVLTLNNRIADETYQFTHDGYTASIYPSYAVSTFYVSCNSSSITIICSNVTFVYGSGTGNTYDIGPTGIGTSTTTNIGTSATISTGYCGGSLAYANVGVFYHSNANITFTSYVCSDGFTFVNTSQNKTQDFNREVTSDEQLNELAYLYPTGGLTGIKIVSDTTTFNSATVFLPAPSGNSGKIYFIKDKSWNAANNPIIVIAPTGVNIDGANTKTINHNGGCLTLVCDGTQYWIANYCTPGTEFSYGVAYGSGHTAKINTFNYIQGDGLNKGGVTLPTATSGAICIIALGGVNNGAAYLYIRTAIDNNTQYYDPYIQTTTYGTPSSPSCFATVMLISDGSTWYTAGTLNGSELNLGTTTSTNTFTFPSTNSFIKANSNTTYSFPTPTLGGIYIMKTTNANTVTYYRSSYFSGIRAPLTSVSCGAQYACIWFVGRNIVNPCPIISYVP